MRLRVFTRLLTAAGTVLLAAAAAPVLAQTADVAVALTSPSPTSTLSLGVAKTYKITVTNNGPSWVTSFNVDATFTAPAAPYNGALKIEPIAGCTPITAGTVVPCTVKLANPLLPGATPISVSIAVVAPVPNPLPTAAADCPGAGTLVHAVISVPQVFQGATDVDPSYANNTVTQDNGIAEFNDLAVTSFTATPNASEGGNIDYAVTLHNYGPCAATTTFSDFSATNTVEFVSATGCVNNATFGADAGCDLSGAPFAVGGDLSYTAVYKVLTFPKSVTHAAVPASVDVVSDQDLLNGPDPTAPDHANSATASTTIDLSKNGGCSTGGAATLAGLLSLVALRLVRRRKA